jgi:hypothetical protein
MKSVDRLNWFMSQSNSSFSIQSHFFKNAKLLRKEFENGFIDPRSTDSKRFIWDFWYFKNQYHHLRTPAHYFFSKKNYVDFHSQLVQWGRSNLGCHDVSPPWLSYYVDGCFQNMHADVPHGPWAFVYSLTPKNRKFEGGETFILKDDVLNYWKSFSDKDHREFKSFFHIIAPEFNQLTVFDPRRPHGVTEVKGSRDPLEARIVIHGWFVEPRPYVVGGLSAKQVGLVLNKLFHNLQEFLNQQSLLHGCLALRLRVNSGGTVSQFKIISNSLIDLYVPENKNIKLIHTLKNYFKKVKFPSSPKPSEMTIPLLFR